MSRKRQEFCTYGGHAMTGANVKETKRKDGRIGRTCRACYNDKKRERNRVARPKRTYERRIAPWELELLSRVEAV